MNSVFTAKYLQTLRNKKGDKGFTLIELLVVVIIIGVLAAVALPNLLAQVGKARESEGKTGVGTITRAQQTRHFETGTFEDEDDAGFSALAGNNLSITVDSEYFNFLSDANDDGTIDPNAGTITGGSATDAASVVSHALPPTDAIAQANGTRAFGSLMEFDSGNYSSILCQTNVVGNTEPVINAFTPAVVDAGGTVTTPAVPANCGAGATEVR